MTHFNTQFSMAVTLAKLANGEAVSTAALQHLAQCEAQIQAQLKARR